MVAGTLIDRLPPPLIERFADDLDRYIAPDARVGLAVSGGPDSLALLLLAAAARPSRIEVATVDHHLREGSADEASFVASICASLGVPHTILVVEWTEQPTTALQERAREERYKRLCQWAEESKLQAVLTGHHRGDQAETLLMRLNRGAGVKGLAAMRPINHSWAVPVVRPLLEWSPEELATICEAAGVPPVADPSNADLQFERVRIRRALADAPWLDVEAIASSARNLRQADEALSWAADAEWARADRTEDAITFLPGDAPPEIRRRLASRAIMALASEGDTSQLGGQQIERIVAQLEANSTATLRGVLCTGGEVWRFSKAPPRRS